jgi:hypothetical protein
MRAFACGPAVLALALAVPAAGAAQAPLKLTGDGAYFMLRVPLDVRAQATSAVLADVRVLNAADEAVPYAWVDPKATATAVPERRAVPLFKAPPVPRVASEPVQPGGWIIDLRAVKGVPQALQFDIATGASGIFPFVLEASPDLQQWRTLLPEAQLVALQHQGLRLEHSHFDLAQADSPATMRYLRLRPRPGHPDPPVTAVHVTSLARQAVLPGWQWSEAISPSRCQPGHCDYVLPRHLPLQRVEFMLTQPNTLAQVQLLAQPDEAAEAPRSRTGHHHPVREHLKVLRHKGAASSPERHEPVFRAVGSGSVYALNLQGSALRSTVVELPGGLYRTLRVRPAGGMVQLGAQPPLLRVAGRAADLVVLARGPAPYRLAWAQTSPPVALPLDQLMPGRRADDPLPTATAAVAPPVAPVAAATSIVASAPPRADAPPDASRQKLWLWAALVAALGLMGFMARSLLKPADKPLA